jgi:hypothetical protein
VFGVVTPARVAPVKASEPVAAAKQAVARLRKQGAQVIVALCGMDRVEARALVKAVPGIDFAIIGADVGDGMAEPEPVGAAWLMAPADQARHAVKLTLERRGEGPLQLHAGEAARARDLTRADKRIATLKVQLAAWKKDPTADAAFVAARQQELAALEAARQKLATSAPPPPPAGNWFSYELVPVRHTIARDPAVADELKQLARAIGKANLAAAQGKAPATAEPGAPSYDCIGCHVTGWEKPGGVNLATVEKRALVDVQCESCHGPGSKHVEEAGLDEPRTIVRKPAERFCADQCHTKEHSDTFTLVPYLRDILGKGHGEKARAALGDGPTGHDIRKKALEAAGR